MVPWSNIYRLYIYGSILLLSFIFYLYARANITLPRLLLPYYKPSQCNSSNFVLCFSRLLYCRSFAISYKFWKLFLNFFENSSCDLDRLYNLQSLKLYRLYKLSSLWRTDILTMSFPIREQGIALHSLRSFISPSNIL